MIHKSDRRPLASVASMATTLLCIAAFFCGTTLSVHAIADPERTSQNGRTVTGTVVDSNGQPAAGIGVMEEWRAMKSL